MAAKKPARKKAATKKVATKRVVKVKKIPRGKPAPKLEKKEVVRLEGKLVEGARSKDR